MATPARPEWLTDEFVKTCVKNDIGAETLDGIDIGEVLVQYVVPKGENYASLILRVVANCSYDLPNSKHNGYLTNGAAVKERDDFTNGHREIEEKRYILKVPNQLESMKELLVEFAAFDREVDMYQTVVPKFQKILKESGLPTQFACRCVNVANKESVFAMEDLGAKKYVLANRIEGADLDHTKVMLLKLARLHGASMRYYEQNSLKGVHDYYFKGLIRKIEDEEIQKIMDPIFGNTMITESVKTLAKDLRKRPGYEKEIKIVEKLTERAYDILCDFFDYKPGNRFNAHLHGDCWINNILYKYDDSGKPIDVMLLDLQCSYLNSIGNEFMYFFLSSTSDVVKERHYNELVGFYFDNLTETLKKVGFEGTRPTLKELHDELVSCSSVFLMVTSFMLPVVKQVLSADSKDRSKSETFSMEELIEMSKDSRSNPIYLDSLFVTIDLLKEIGTFEQFKD